MLANSLYLNLAIPVIGACLIALLHQHRRAFELVFIGTAALLLWNTLRLFDLGQAAYFTNISPFSLIDSIPLAFHLEPLGLLFAGIASSLFLVTTLYAIYGSLRHGPSSNLPITLKLEPLTNISARSLHFRRVMRAKV